MKGGTEPREPARSGDEQDVVVRFWRRMLCRTNRAGVCAKAKRTIRRRERRNAKPSVIQWGACFWCEDECTGFCDHEFDWTNVTRHPKDVTPDGRWEDGRFVNSPGWEIGGRWDDMGLYWEGDLCDRPRKDGDQ